MRYAIVFLLPALGAMADVTGGRVVRGSYLKRGHTLVAYYGGVVELDARGNEVWRYRAQGTRGAQRLKNGNTLITVNSQKRVLEVDPSGRTVWEVTVDTQYVHHAMRAENGITWVASASSDARSGVIGFGPDGSARTHHKAEWPLTLHVLRSGNIVANLSNPRKASEFDTTGRVVWEWKGQKEHYGIERLPNGNTLIGQSDVVVEVDPKGRVVWELPTPAGSYIYAIKRLRNGNTLLGGLQGKLVEVDSKGQILWTFVDSEFGNGAYPGPHQVDRGE